jgi:hypothetical protein
VHQVGLIYKISTRVMVIKCEGTELRPALLMNIHTCYGIRHLMELYIPTTISRRRADVIRSSKRLLNTSIYHPTRRRIPEGTKEV